MATKYERMENKFYEGSVKFSESIDLAKEQGVNQDTINAIKVKHAELLEAFRDIKRELKFGQGV